MQALLQGQQEQLTKLNDRDDKTEAEASRSKQAVLDIITKANQSIGESNAKANEAHFKAAIAHQKISEGLAKMQKLARQIRPPSSFTPSSTLLLQIWTLLRAPPIQNN